VLILSFIISPEAIGRLYSPAKFECPDTVALTNRWHRCFAFAPGSAEARSACDPETGGGAAFDRYLSAS
jgi:hypothetical protein